jgi:uncharacterized protein YegP (UPF0339 family)
MNGTTYPCYSIEQDSRGEWRWTYYTPNARVAAVSFVGYKTSDECVHAIQRMKDSAQEPVYLQGTRDRALARQGSLMALRG